MRFGMHYFWTQGSPEETVAAARRCESNGFDFFGLTDSQLLTRDVFTSLALVASETTKLSLGPMVTNPVTRHPSVIASAICSIDEITESRVILGIGTGHSSVDTIGETPATLSTMREAIPTITSLCRGEDVEMHGDSFGLDWLHYGKGSADVPVFMAAEGPKTQRLAGRIADGVIFNGPHPETVRDSIHRIDSAAKAAGREPGDVERWVKVRANVSDDTDSAIREITSSLADYAYVSLKGRTNREGIPSSLRDDVERFVNEYRSHSGYHSDDADTVSVVDELDLLHFFADRYAIVGTPDECVQQFRELQRIEGVDGVLMATETTKQGTFIDRMGSEVLRRG